MDVGGKKFYVPKLCLVTLNHYKYDKGGGELQGYLLAREFHEKGWEIHYAFICDSDVEHEDDSGVKLYKLPKRKVLRRLGKYFFLDYFALQRILEHINPDIIYQRGGSAYTGICARYAKRKRKALIWATQSIMDCVNKRRELVNVKFNPIRHSMEIINYWFTIYGMKNADRIITQAQYQSRLLRENFGLESLVIPNSHYIPMDEIVKEKPPIVAWIANIKEWKQPEIFIQLAKSCRDLDSCFILAGRPGATKYQDSLISSIEKAPNAKYIGEIPFDETNQLLSRASVFVNTSLQHEGFPNTFIQAWLQKTPVVSLNVDPDDVLKREEIGFHSKSYDQLVKDVRFLVRNEKERKRLGERGRHYAERQFDIKRNTLKLQEIFEQILRHSKKRARHIRGIGANHRAPY